MTKGDNAPKKGEQGFQKTGITKPTAPISIAELKAMQARENAKNTIPHHHFNKFKFVKCTEVHTRRMSTVNVNKLKSHDGRQSVYFGQLDSEKLIIKRREKLAQDLLVEVKKLTLNQAIDLIQANPNNFGFFVNLLGLTPEEKIWDKLILKQKRIIGYQEEENLRQELIKTLEPLKEAHNFHNTGEWLPMIKCIEGTFWAIADRERETPILTQAEYKMATRRWMYAKSKPTS